MDNLVSVIMPSYNTGIYIGESIRAVINQTYQNWELIIVDDCSTDNTKEVIESFLTDPRIRYIINERNIGAALCRNRALREAKGRWIAFLDSDDLWYPEKLEKQVLFMESKGYKFSYTNYEEINEKSLLTGVQVTGPNKITRKGMYRYCWPGCLTVMYDKSAIGEVEIKDIKKNNDYAMWLKICEKADCWLLDEILAQYRRGRNGSISNQNILTMIVWHYKLFRENNNIVKSLLYTCKNLVFGVYKKVRYVKKK